MRSSGAHALNRSAPTLSPGKSSTPNPFAAMYSTVEREAIVTRIAQAVPSLRHVTLKFRGDWHGQDLTFDSDMRVGTDMQHGP